MLNSFGKAFKHPPSANVVHTLSVNRVMCAEESLPLVDAVILVLLKLEIMDGST